MSAGWGATDTIPSGDAGDALKAELEQRIASKEWPVGYRLPGERTLATEYGVSRAVVREVLQALESQGSIRVSPARGAFVIRPDGSALSGALSQMLRSNGATVRDVAAARSLLESEVSAYAAANRGGALGERLSELAELVDSGADRLAQGINDLKFHSLLCLAAGNPVLTAMHRAIAPYVLLMTLRREREHVRGGAMHSQLADAVRRGDVDAARVLTAAHLEVTERYFGTDFDRPVAEVAAENLARISSGMWSLEDVERRAYLELDALLRETEEDR